jgi:hypothetical protein
MVVCPGDCRVVVFCCWGLLARVNSVFQAIVEFLTVFVGMSFMLAGVAARSSDALELLLLDLAE